MWKKQIRAEEAAREAQVLSDRAAQLRERSLGRPSSRDGQSSEDTSENEDTMGNSHGTATIAGRVIGRAAEGLRGAADILRGQIPK